MSKVLVVVYLCAVWQMLLVLLGLFGRGKQEVVGCVTGRVLVMIPAHNEERVICSAVESVLYSGCDVVVICDSCTDRTYELAGHSGAFVFSCEKGNKGAAINAFLDESLLPFAYDYLAVVDCGSEVGAGFGGALCKALRDAEYAQGWVRSCGALTWVGAWYSWLYGLQHLIQQGRSMLGLPVVLAGMGFGWRVTEQVRFNESCLVEDLELSLRVHGAGKRVVYADLGVVDEKPARFWASVRQRVRWARGGWWLFFHGRWLTYRVDDVVTALGEVVAVVAGMLVVIGCVRWPVTCLVWFLLYEVVGVAGMVRLGDGYRVRLSLIPAVPLMSVVESLVAIYALCTVGRHEWNRTEHGVLDATATR